jgi:hypothetical protein
MSGFVVVSVVLRSFVLGSFVLGSFVLGRCANAAIAVLATAAASRQR